jgi:hypothetical protein
MEIRNAKYTKTGTIDCEIEHLVHGWIPFTASPDDIEKHGRDLYKELLSSNNVSKYVPPTKLELDESLAAALRYDRDMLLVSEVDKVAGNALRWSSLSQDKQLEWGVYREALLDVPQQSGFPNDVTWPTKPQ